MRTQLKLAIEEDRSQKEDKKPGFMDHVSSAAAAVGSVAADVASGLAEGLGLADITEEQAIREQNVEMQLDIAEHDETNAALEALAFYSHEIDALVQTKQCSPATLRLVTEGINLHLSHLGEQRLQLPALEDATDITAQHQQLNVALESVLGRIGQSVVMGFKHHWNAVADLLRTTNSQVGKYQGKLESAQKEFDGVKDKLPKSEHMVSLTELWYFFSHANEHWNRYVGATKPNGMATDQPKAVAKRAKENNSGERTWTDLPAALEDDVKASTYALKTYPAQMLQLLKQALSKLGDGKALATEDGLKKLEQQFAAMKHPVALFDTKLLKPGYPLFNMTGFQIKEGKASPRLADNPKLARISQSSYVEEHTSGAHQIDKAASYVADFAAPPLGTLATAVMMWAPKNVEFTTEHIQQVIKSGQGYLDNVREWRKLSEQLQQLRKDAEALMSVKAPAEGDHIAKAILAYVNNIVQCFTNPASDELVRSIKAAKYCHYLSLRMIHHAKRGN